MPSRLLCVFCLVLTPTILLTSVNAQTTRSTVAGRVTDSSGAVLPGAKVELQPSGFTVVSDANGQFTITNVAPGDYTLTVNYVGFAPYSQQLTLTAGQVSRISAGMKVASANESIVVTSERGHGEAAAINVQRESDNILQVLPVEVITSLPNTNIADALGRLPSVTLERDEGEGKYVQIRGTEPRLNNVTINGVNVPSPEGDVRQIKLDVIPANLVDSVEINKTLSANQDGDAIGGSVNLVTKTAEEKPTFYLNGIGGYTPIIGGRSLSEIDGTVGQRFGERKKLGILFGASYDWNGRGINDVEPVPTVVGCGGGQCKDFSADATAQAPFFTSYNTEDLRNYRYDRTRYGFTGNIDYKLGDISGVYVRFLYSHFDNFGDRWVYSPTVGTFSTPTLTNPDGTMSFNSQARRPVQVIGSLEAGGKHAAGRWLAIYEIAVSRASTEDRGYATASFDGTGAAFTNLTFAIEPNSHKPRLFSANGVNLFDPSQYTLATSDGIDITRTYSPQLNLEGAFSLARNYKAGSHFGTFEFGAKLRNAHKFEDAREPVYSLANGATAPSMSSFLGSFSDGKYYDGAYPGAYNGPQADYGKVNSFYRGNVNNPNVLVVDNNYDLIERVAAGYVMNTLQFGRVRLQTGLRFEGTDESVLGYHVFFDSNGVPCSPGEVDPLCPAGLTNSVAPIHKNPSYLDPLPSVQVRFGLGADSDIRVAYGRGISRPNFSDLPPFFNNQDSSTRIKIGNPNLKPSHANNFDVLFEQYLKPLGVIQGGFFYKQLSDPIYEDVDSTITTDAFGPQYVGFTLRQPINGKSANIYGFEIAFQQHLTFLPGALAGFGLSANYGYSHSSTDGVPLRTDKPALLRQAPNTFNFSPTYDRWRLSARLGLSYNGANIFAYNYQNLNPDGTPAQVPLGSKGPFGDVYLYQHTQVDAQASFRMYRGLQFIFAGLNLTNEVFGFYQGSGIYPIQREYYKPSYEFGLRYTLTGEK
jgi:TonB-dependent receptor